MDIEKIKEDLSICYIKTIAAVRGIAVERIEHDEDSVDVVIKKVLHIDKNVSFNSQISVQLKATSSKSQYSIGKQEISYKLKVKNYNDLCMPATMPSMLALLILPEEIGEWTKWTPDELMIKGKMFWLSLQDQEVSDNKDNVTVKIPKENILNADTIENLIKKAAEEGIL